MDNVCSLNTVYRDCSSGVAFSYCSEDRWGFQKHPLEQQSWGFGSRWVSGVFISVYSVYTLSLVEKEPYLGDTFGSRPFCSQAPLGLSSRCGGAAAPERCGAAPGALAATGQQRELGESGTLLPQPNKTTARPAIALPAYELCSLQTFTFPDSKPSCQKFSFIFHYFFPALFSEILHQF